MNKYAIINNNLVTNIIVWDGKTEYNSEGILILLSEDNPAGPGWLYENNDFIPPIEEDSGV